MKNGNHVIPLIFLAITVLAVTAFGVFAMWWGLSFNVQAQTVANILAPLAMAAAFIERAVEVVITPWRDPEANRLQAQVDAAQKDPAAIPNEKDARDALNAYVGKTTQYAFAASLMFGLVAAMVGVRAFWFFLAPQGLSSFNSAPLGQRNTFIIYDVVLSAALMAGGANGVHSIVTSITTFFDTTTQKSMNSAKS